MTNNGGFQVFNGKKIEIHDNKNDGGNVQTFNSYEKRSKSFTGLKRICKFENSFFEEIKLN
jgi:hypothetical protein